jgi:hypothetical protein
MLKVVVNVEPEKEISRNKYNATTWIRQLATIVEINQ